jgi:hypothetical protein
VIYSILVCYLRYLYNYYIEQEQTMSSNDSSSTDQNVLEPRAVTRDLFSATIGSILCCYVGQPFDTVKVKQQTNPDRYGSVLSSTKQILQNEGVAAFWKGAVPTAGGMVLEVRRTNVRNSFFGLCQVILLSHH